MISALLWRLYWTIEDVTGFLLDAAFPISFIVSAIGCGFGLGYLYRFLFREGNIELLIMREIKTEVLTMQKSSICIYRSPGLITMRPTCSQRKKACPWYRAAWCIPMDLIGAAVKPIWKMLFLV